MPRDDPRFAPLARRLAEQVNQYQASWLPSAQRRFLMEALTQLNLPDAAFPTRPAEELAAEYLEASQPAAEPLRVLPTALSDVLADGLRGRPSGPAIPGGKLLGELSAACQLDEPFAGIVTRLELPGQPAGGEEPFLAVPVSVHFPGWRLAVHLVEDPFAASAEKAESLYLVAGVSAIALIAILAVTLASYFSRQIRLTRLKNDLIATVSHELKTPLASMRVLVDTLREGRCSDAQQAGEYLELIAREQERLSRLIDNFLTFSRMERNKRAFAFAAVDLADRRRTAAESVRERFSADGARLDLDLPAGLPKVRADRDALVTVILNLLDNAWKYTGDRKHVTVCGPSRDDGRCSWRSAITAIGLTRRAQRRIFDRFYQVDQTLTRNAGGCGLGLAIVKFILDAHGGTIGVESQPGQGSTFTIGLPSQHEPAEATSLRGLPQTTRSDATMPAETILIVEDDAALLRGLEGQLRVEGYRVATAADGQQGLAAALSRPARPDPAGHHAAEGQRLRDLPPGPQGGPGHARSSCSPPRARSRTSSWA